MPWQKYIHPGCRLALAVKSSNTKIIYQDILTALADATNDLFMPCLEQRTGAPLYIARLTRSEHSVWPCKALHALPVVHDPGKNGEATSLIHKRRSAISRCRSRHRL